MSVRTTSVNSRGEMGLIKYFATPASSALVFQSPNVVAVSRTMGMPDVAGSRLSITVASTAFISGRCKSVIMRSGRSAKALLIPCAEYLAREVSYPASCRQKARSSDKSGLSSTISIFGAIDRMFHRATLWPGLFDRKLRASTIKSSLLRLCKLPPMPGVTQAIRIESDPYASTNWRNGLPRCQEVCRQDPRLLQNVGKGNPIFLKTGAVKIELHSRCCWELKGQDLTARQANGQGSARSVELSLVQVCFKLAAR